MNKCGGVSLWRNANFNRVAKLRLFRYNENAILRGESYAGQSVDSKAKAFALEAIKACRELRIAKSERCYIAVFWNFIRRDKNGFTEVFRRKV